MARRREEQDENGEEQEPKAPADVAGETPAGFAEFAPTPSEILAEQNEQAAKTAEKEG